MGISRFWTSRWDSRPLRLLQPLEERIVLDAAVAQTQDNPDNQVDTNTNPTDGGDAGAPVNAAAPESSSGGGDAGLAANVPDSFDSVFNQDLNVVLIASNVGDTQAISDAANPDAKVIVYDALQDNLATVTAQLQDMVNTAGHTIDNLAIVGHSSTGILSVGTDDIQFFALGDYRPTFEALGQLLSPDAQIQFYGCAVAGDAVGEALVDRIAMYTAADVFASIDATGGGGSDWDLEYGSNQAITLDPVLDAAALDNLGIRLSDPELVKDIDQSPASSDPWYLTEVNGKIFFSASWEGYGRELWIYDSATDTVTMVKDIGPGFLSGSPSNLTNVNGTLFFTADDWFHGTELWKSDGTEAGTVLVKDIYLGTTSAQPSSLTNVNGTLFFHR